MESCVRFQNRNWFLDNVGQYNNDRLSIELKSCVFNIMQWNCRLAGTSVHSIYYRSYNIHYIQYWRHKMVGLKQQFLNQFFVLLFEMFRKDEQSSVWKILRNHFYIKMTTIFNADLLMQIYYELHRNEKE